MLRPMLLSNDFPPDHPVLNSGGPRWTRSPTGWCTIDDERFLILDRRWPGVAGRQGIRLREGIAATQPEMRRTIMAEKFRSGRLPTPVAGKEDEFNEWYDKCAHPGTALRCSACAVGHPLCPARRGDLPRRGRQSHRSTNTCVYEMEGDVDEHQTKTRRCRWRPGCTGSDSLDLPSSRIVLDPRKTVTPVTLF